MEKARALGLSTVLGIAQQAGGSVWVYSELGKGSTFKVYFPRVETAVDAASQPTTPRALRGTETVLLVEDQDQVRAVAHDILRRHGYQVIVAQSAAEALLRCEAERGPIQLLLTDVVMPHMSGADSPSALGSRGRTPKCCSCPATTDDSVVRHGRPQSGVFFLQKPFTPDSLARMVRAALSATRRRETRVADRRRSEARCKHRDVRATDPGRHF